MEFSAHEPTQGMGRVQDLRALALPQQDGILLSPPGQVISRDHVDVKDLRVRGRSCCVRPALGPARPPRTPGSRADTRAERGWEEGRWASQGLRLQGPEDSVGETQPS